MDSYFKAAVCDLDKLLDDFEQSTDEVDCSRAAVSLCSTVHHLFPSALHHLELESQAITLQHSLMDSTALKLHQKLDKTVDKTIFGELAVSAQYERNVMGLDLLSTVDSSTSNEVQPSSLGRCSVPVCDLISDTGNLILATASKDEQELQPENLLSHKDCLLGFDLSPLPATLLVSSKEDSSSSGPVEQNITEAFLSEAGPFKACALSLQDLETAGCISTEVSELYVAKSRTEFTKNHRDENINNIGVTTGNLNMANSKDEGINTELSLESLVKENTNSLTNNEKNSERSGVKTEPKEHTSIGAMSSVLSKRGDLCEEYIALRLKEGNSSDVSLCEKGFVTLEKEQYQDKIRSVYSGNDTSEMLEDSSLTSCPSTEDDQPSLSCIPLAISMCGSLVVTDDKEHGLTPQEKERVVSNAVTMHEATSNDLLPDWVSFGQMDSSSVAEKEENLGKINQTFVGEDRGGEMDRNERWGKAITKEESSKEIAAFPSAAESESNFTSSDTYQPDIYYKEDVSTVEEAISQALLTADEDMFQCDMLISDAELDAFLNEQTIQHNSKPHVDNVSMSDANQVSLIKRDEANDDGNDLDVPKVYDTNVKLDTQAQDTVVSDGVGTFDLTNEECKLDSLSISLTGNTQCVNHKTETEKILSHNALNQAINTGGARPKTACETELSKSLKQSLVETRNEQQQMDYGTPSVIPSGTDLSPSVNDSGIESNLKVELESVSDSTEKQQIASNEESAHKGTILGQKQPSWVPDVEAPNCMNCQVKFTFTKRRHHCRACGKVFCTACCNRKCKLQYMEKEARVCIVCYDSINKAQAFERMMSPTAPCPNPNTPSEYCSSIPPLHQAQAAGTLNSPLPTVMVPVSILKPPGIEGTYAKEQKRVWFADGILPNGEVADTTKLSSGSKRSSPVSPVDSECQMVVNLRDDDPHVADVESKELTNTLGTETEQLFNSVPVIPSHTELPVACFSTDKMRCNIAKYVSKEISLLPEEEDQLPPLLVAVGEDSIVENHPSHKQLMLLLDEGGPDPLTFILNANLLVNVKLTSYSSEKCWYFSTNGLHGLGQAEIIILLLCLPHEDTLPKDIFKLFLNIYKDALKGKYIGNLENISFTESFLNSKDHGGFLFFTPTYQDLSELSLPNSPFICGTLIQKLEVPWAKIFPIRLMLRLGAEYGVYPSPVTSIRHRKPLFGEIGHTIMNLLADLRNFQYTLPTVDGLLIHMEMGKSCIKIPVHRYSEVLKLINSFNEHVISIGASFSLEADSHLVCVQNDEGQYQTQANSATDQPRKVTGASFVVFNGSLKTSSGFLAKSSIVEDGLMVQITLETMEALRQALREKRDFRITCGKLDAGDLREDVNICWVESEEKVNKGVVSPIDGQSMEGIPSERIFQEADFETDDKLVKCTEVFYLLRGADPANTATHYQFAKEVGTACSAALCPHLKVLKENGMSKIGLRISMDIDMVEYRAGSGGQLLPQHYLNELDSALVPVIHGRTSDTSSLPIMMELFFFLIENLF